MSLSIAPRFPSYGSPLAHFWSNESRHTQPMRGRHSFSLNLAFACTAIAGLSVLPEQSQPAKTTTAPAIIGYARIIDGDTIAIGHQRIRLYGIDAPERKQVCASDGDLRWRCGVLAAAALARMTQGRVVTCRVLGRDAYRRALGQCSTHYRDLNATMVRQGFAWAFVRYSRRYEREEAEARRSRRGVWGGDSVPPWQYRSQSRR